ncbi:hypothetical protein JGZ04_09780 [Staphylococcus pseudintermedius]|uniref:cysteine peptidase family C39 domain-containing protein n=1 Tax=Staphylococcus pseudintermedius TaxID=283734 RepID=UPI0018F713F4|nr:cysteine peptidase family C39 domain-containing protein [Staphylococcus pseudintermedius]MBJ8317624.1 hypothetical protein [Staphylococcus pseudintermedius]
MRCDKKYIYIADPVVNLTKMPYREFKEEWTGVTILLKPTSLCKPIKQDKVRLTYFIPLLLKEKKIDYKNNNHFHFSQYDKYFRFIFYEVNY